MRVGRSDALESRRRILCAARELFAERGVDAVSMHEIGRTAGVGQGTLYRHFGHKGALCSALLRERIEAFSGEVSVRVERGGGEPALGLLGWFFGRLAGFNEANGPLLGAIRDAAGGERRVEMYRNPFYQWLRGVVAVLLARALERGEARPDLDVECLSDALLAPLNIDLYIFQRQELGMERERIIGSLASILDGLRVRRGEDTPSGRGAGHDRRC